MSGMGLLARRAGGFDLRRSLLALAVASSLGNGPRGDFARAHHEPQRARQGEPARIAGEHAVRAGLARPGLTLVLKRGFELRFSALTSAGEAWLRVARERARSERIAVGFVPLGPTVESSAAHGRAEASFVADHFRVRAGHRLVLAVERASTWQLLPARYEGGRCQARIVGELGGRMQFGSLP